MKRIKQILMAALLLVAMATSSQAQIYITDEEKNLRPTEGEIGLANPQFAQGYDYYVPLSDSLILLTAMGSIYLLKKKKMNK